MAGPAGKQALDAAVGKGALNGKLLGQLHLHVVAGRDVEAAAHRLLALAPGVEEGQHLSAGIHGCEQVRHDRHHERFGQVVESRPQQHHIEDAPGEVEGAIEKAFDIPDRIAVFVAAGLPVSVQASWTRSVRKMLWPRPVR